MSAQLTARKRVKYPPEQMAIAIKMVRSGEMSKKAAAKTYGIPRTTLLDKLAGRVPEQPTAIGRKTILTEAEENTLVVYAHGMASIGYPLTRKEFLRQVKQVIDIDGRVTPFNNNLPGKKWFASFKQRHATVAMRTPMSLGHERAIVSLDMINNWYTTLLNFLKREIPDYQTLIKNPRRVFNGDESGFPLAVKAGQVIAAKGARHVYQVVTNTKVQVTVMAAFNAFGDYVPPMILFPGERLRDVGLSGFPEATYATTKNGWMDTETFVEFLKLLYNTATSKEITFPVLLFVDGHSTHISLQAAEYCKEHGIILYCLLPNATHILQACDIGFFSPMKSVWQSTVKDWQMANIGLALSKKEFPSLFKKTWDAVATFENAAHGFRRSGLFPLTPSGIDVTKLGPSAMSVASPPKPDMDGSGDACSTVRTIPQDTVVDTVNEPLPSVSDCTSADVAPAFLTLTTPVPKEKKKVVILNQKSPMTTTMPSTATSADVAPAFLTLTTPVPKEKKKVVRLTQKIPKALTGTEALKMLREREEKKISEEAAKVKRMEMRKQRRLEKEYEKKKKEEQRQLKKRKIVNKPTKKSKKQDSTVSKDGSSSSDSDRDIVLKLTDFDSDTFEEEFDLCPGCNKGDQPPSRWVRCDECDIKWHFLCANRPEFELLDSSERKHIEFACPLCA